MSTMSATAHPAPGLSRLSATAYRLQQGGLATLFGATTRVWLDVMHRGYKQPDWRTMRGLAGRFLRLLQQDLDNVERGHYPGHLLFQFPQIASYLRMLPEIADEMRRMTVRSWRKVHRDLPADVDITNYPAYYPRNFHWQTDGWFSARAARRFDPLADVFFAGTVDVMRRMAIPPVATRARTRPGLRVLDLASCTGHFLAQLRIALPDAELHGIDLSEPFLEHAGELLRDADVTLHRGDIEALPFADGSFDVVTGLFLFHEMPRDVRRRIAREAFRVLRSGGSFVVLGGLQHVDAPELAFYLDTFGELFHEPYHKGYTRDPLADMLSECGFIPRPLGHRFLAKLVAADKPSQ